MQNVAVDKNANENNTSLIRRFTKRVQESGVLRRVRGIRYTERAKSDYVKKKNTLKILKKKAKIEEYLKLGKPVELLKRK
jgi:ribosomal protein S21